MNNCRKFRLKYSTYSTSKLEEFYFMDECNEIHAFVVMPSNNVKADTLSIHNVSLFTNLV